jgi:hypothetical protein
MKIVLTGLLAAVIITYLTCIPAFSSEEDYIGWKSFVIECFETPKAGKISCEAVRNEKGFAKFIIRAFSKEYALTKDQLTKLEGFPLESLKISHEAGYEEIGGYTLHFCFYRYKKHEGKEAPVREVIYISINAGGLTVGEPR